MDYSLWGRKEWDTTEQLSTTINAWSMHKKIPNKHSVYAFFELFELSFFSFFRVTFSLHFSSPSYFTFFISEVVLIFFSLIYSQF